MAYKKYYETIHQSNDEYRVLANVFFQGTHRGFKHGVDSIAIMDNNKNVLYSKIFDKPITVNYVNRTWEQYEYQTVLVDTIHKLSSELKEKNIDSNYIIKEVL